MDKGIITLTENRNFVPLKSTAHVYKSSENHNIKWKIGLLKTRERLYEL